MVIEGKSTLVQNTMARNKNKYINLKKGFKASGANGARRVECKWFLRAP